MVKSSKIFVLIVKNAPYSTILFATQTKIIN